MDSGKPPVKDAFKVTLTEEEQLLQLEHSTCSATCFLIFMLSINRSQEALRLHIVSGFSTF